MLFSLVFFAIGVVVLLKGADILVEGASALAQRFKINPVVVGLTIVAFGTSAPELVVSVTSAISGNTGVALGNIVGSNIANILLILGAAAVIYPLKVHKNTIWKEVPMSFLAVIILAILGMQHLIDERNIFALDINTKEIVGLLTIADGLILLSFFIIFIYYTFGIAKVSADTAPEPEKLTLPKSSLFIVGGLVGLIIGSKFVVDNAVLMAQSIGVSDTFIGLTLVAVGTSLPELITSVVAATKKKVDIAVGNVVGSNIFNIFLILGITSLVRPIPLTGQNIADILVLVGVTMILFISLFIYKRHIIGKPEGISMLALYIAYIAFLIIRE